MSESSSIATTNGNRSNPKAFFDAIVGQAMLPFLATLTQTLPAPEARRNGRPKTTTRRLESQGLTVYLARAISGCDLDEVFSYYDRVASLLRRGGWRVFSPMACKDHLRGKGIAERYTDAVCCNRAIVGRDKWMVGSSDVLYANLSGAETVSIGCIAEITLAAELGRHVVVAMETDNVHRHPFVMEAADVMFTTERAALEYLLNLNLYEVS